MQYHLLQLLGNVCISSVDDVNDTATQAKYEKTFFTTAVFHFTIVINTLCHKVSS